MLVMHGLGMTKRYVAVSPLMLEMRWNLETHDVATLLVFYTL